MNDNMKYELLIGKIKDAMENLEKLGMNIDSYKKDLDLIIWSTDESGKDKSNPYQVNYALQIKKLNELTQLLDEYENYFKIINSVKYSKLKLEKDISLLDLDALIEETVSNLLEISKDDNIPYENKKKCIDDLYDLALKIIKLEIINKNDSNLYNLCLDDRIEKYFFNDIIKKEINQLELPSEAKRRLDLKIADIEKKGLNASYFDYDLIKLLADFDPKFGKKEIVRNELEKRLDEITQEE